VAFFLGGGAFAKLRIATISFVMSPSVRIKQLGANRTDLDEI